MKIASGGRIDLAALTQHDQQAKPSGYADAVAELVALYEDGPAAQAVIRTYLHRLGLGLRGNHQPLQLGLLSYIVDRLACRYDAPPSRSLLRPSGTAYRETSSEHKAMLRVLDDLGWDGLMREADRYAALCGMAVLRLYPTDYGLSGRLFTPDLVLRVPSPAIPDRIEHDAAVALKLAGDAYEVHWKGADGAWRMAWTTADGRIRDDSPFGAEDPVTGYALLPLVVLYHAPPAGRAWLMPRVSRSAYVAALAGLANDLQAMTALQAHSSLVYLTADPNNEPPSITGPGQVMKIHNQDEVRFETPNPLIQQVESVMTRLVTLFLYGESIPLFEVDGRTVLTGAALKVAERGLQARRETGIPLAQKTERAAWRVIVELHNAHAAAWGVEPLPTDTTLSVQLAAVDQPEDAATILENGARAIALGAASVIDLIQRLYSCSRDEAISRYQQAGMDAVAYPPAAADFAANHPPDAADVAAVADASSVDALAVAAGQGTAGESNVELAQTAMASAVDGTPR